MEKKIEEQKQIIENRLIESIKNKENVTKERMEEAEKINFKSIPETVLATDEFGFIKKEGILNTNIDPKEKQKELLKINARIEKWNTMLSQYELFTKSKFSKLKSRTRKGVPDSLRGYVWQQFAEVSKYHQPNIYKQLVEDKECDPDTEAVILKDLDRTFPHNFIFKDKYGQGQRSLYHVLRAYSKYNKDTGYVQGMGFITALLLTYMDEESSIFLLHSLMKKHDLEQFYLPDFPGLKKTFYVQLCLMKKYIPKVYEVLKKNEVMPSMYASEWYITCFTRELDFKILVRIFDVFLLEKNKIMYRFALAFLKLKEEKFLNAKGGIAGVMSVFKDILLVDDVEHIFKIAFDFPFRRKFIKHCEEEYEKVKNDPKNEFMSLLL